MRKIKFQTGEYYHIFNRGVDKRNIFIDEKDFVRLLIGMKEFNQITLVQSLRNLNRQAGVELLQACRSSTPAPTKLVKIICYCLNPNHYHFLVKQLEEKGVEKFMHKLGTGYTNYFNQKYNRSGALFQGRFKSVHIKTDGYFLQLSCYINGNPEIHKIGNAEDWIYSSYQDYLGLRDGKLCDKNVILKEFRNVQEYKNLVDVIIKESGERKDEIKKYLLEE